MADKQYKALKPVGRWAVGETIGALPIEQIIQLESDGIIEAIEELPPKAEVKQSNKKQVGENNVEA